MLAVLVVALGPATVAGSYPATVHEQLTAAAPGWISQYSDVLRASVRKPRVGVFEIHIDARGNAERIGVGHTTGDNTADDLARTFLLAAEPLAAPPAEALTDGKRAHCVVRLVLDRKSLATAVACFPPDSTVPEVAGLTQRAGSASDPGARLFAGWVNEAADAPEAAIKLYHKATKSARNWDLAARAYGLLLVRANRAEEAMPFLQLYIESRAAPTDVNAYARELKRYARYQQEKQKPRTRLSKSDIAEGVQAGFEMLEPCLRGARKEYKVAVGSDTLLMSWKIRKDGTVYSARLEGPRQMMMTSHADCIEATVERWSFPAFLKGGEVTMTKVPIKVRGTDGPRPEPKTITASRSTRGPAAKPTFTSCQRSQGEIMAYIQKAFPQLNKCMSAEKRRAPTARFPDQLPIGFVVAGTGGVRSIEVKHRHFRTGPLHTCVAAALTGSMDNIGGADCPASFEMDLRRF